MTLQQRPLSIGLLCTVSVVMLLTVSARSVDGVEVPDPSIMLLLVPAAAKANTPPCIKPGTRLTYFGMTASIPGEYKKLVQDDNGQWVDQNTGKHYREEDISGSGSAAFVLCDDEAEAAEVLERFPDDLPGRTVLVRQNPW